MIAQGGEAGVQWMRNSFIHSLLTALLTTLVHGVLNVVLRTVSIVLFTREEIDSERDAASAGKAMNFFDSHAWWTEGSTIIASTRVPQGVILCRGFIFAHVTHDTVGWERTPSKKIVMFFPRWCRYPAAWIKAGARPELTIRDVPDLKVNGVCRFEYKHIHRNNERWVCSSKCIDIKIKNDQMSRTLKLVFSVAHEIAQGIKDKKLRNVILFGKAGKGKSTTVKALIYLLDWVPVVWIADMTRLDLQLEEAIANSPHRMVILMFDEAAKALSNIDQENLSQNERRGERDVYDYGTYANFMDNTIGNHPGVLAVIMAMNETPPHRNMVAEDDEEVLKIKGRMVREGRIDRLFRFKADGTIDRLQPWKEEECKEGVKKTIKKVSRR